MGVILKWSYLSPFIPLYQKVGVSIKYVTLSSRSNNTVLVDYSKTSVGKSANLNYHPIQECHPLSRSIPSVQVYIRLNETITNKRSI